MPIVLENVSYTYMSGSPLSFPALHGVSLTIQEGEFLGVIGHTGAGKSTLMQHLNGLLVPTSGRVLVDGFDTRDKKQRAEARKRVGMVFQYPEYQLFEETVKKDIAFGPKNLGLTEAEIAARVSEAMRLVGLDEKAFAELSPFDLSGGEKRRAALAGILAMRPKYLVLDEPMAGLDPRGRRDILAMVSALRAQSGCTIVMVSHSMDDIAAAADRVLVLHDGATAMLDAPGAVFARADELAAMGLSIPQSTRLASLLRKRGLAAPENVCRMDELRDFIVGRYQNGH